jgi:hypothetical protein
MRPILAMVASNSFGLQSVSLTFVPGRELRGRGAGNAPASRHRGLGAQERQPWSRSEGLPTLPRPPRSEHAY